MARVYRAKGTRGWSIDFEDPVTGKRIREVVATTKRGAEQVLAERLTASYAAPRSTQSKNTVGLLFEAWKVYKARKSSLSADESRWVWIIRYFGAEKPLAEITLADGLAFQTWLTTQSIERKRKGEKVAHSAASVNRIVELLKAALNYAANLPLKDRMVSENPLRMLKRLPEHNKRDRIVTEDELASIIEFGSARIGLAALISFKTGMSQGEICDLLWRDIDLERRVFTVFRSKTKRSRIVPFNAVIKAAIEHWALRAPDRKTEPRFLSIDADNFSSQFSRLIQELRLSDLKFHDLRHTAATNMRRAGVDIATIKQFIGHASWQMVMRYQTVDETDLHQALDKVNGKKASNGD